LLASERKVLLELVEAHFCVIENKKTDAVTKAEKSEEWRKIQLEFQQRSTIHVRTPAYLKGAWENIKKRKKTECASQKKAVLGTGTVTLMKVFIYVYYHNYYLLEMLPLMLLTVFQSSTNYFFVYSVIHFKAICM